MFFIEKQKPFNNNLAINEEDFDYFHEEENYEWYINGVLFYVIDNGSILIRDKINNKILNSLFKDCNFEPGKIKNALEGHYICVTKQADQIKVFGDRFNRRNLFYYEDDQTVYFDTKLTKNLIKKCDQKINKMNLFSYLLLGYGHSTTTIFEKIYRLGYQEYMLFKDNSFNIIKEFEPLKIEKYGKQQLSEFEKLFTDSISARMAEKGTNWLMVSSGWDSTLILDILLKLTDEDNVNTAIFEVLLRDGQFFNIFEIQKIEEITRHYNLEPHHFHVDLNDKKLVEQWKNYVPCCFVNHVFQWPLNHFGIVDYILQLDSNVGAIFNGECADSFQNYGFSQYLSLPSGNNDFDEYADKMKTYLYGPTFLSKVKNRKFREDVIYVIFKKMKENVDFYDENNYLKAMLSFIYSPTRLPFTLPKTLPVFKEGVLERFFDKASKDYFEEYYKILNSKNIYSIWNALYADFHFRGLSVPMSIVGIENAGVIAALPFFDMRLADYFAKMPEEWGKGLNLNPVKYPEKMLALKSKTFPLHIVDKKSTHSYISEVNPSINFYYEIYCNSSVGDYFKEILSEKDSLDFLKNVEGIDLEYIHRIKNNFIDEKLSMKDFNIMSKICTLASIMNEYLQKELECSSLV